jgi:PAS domain S-box-containing protein
MPDHTPGQEGNQAQPAPEHMPAVPPDGAPDDLADGAAGAPSRTERVLDVVATAGGLLCAAGGLTVMAAWFARATAVLRLGSQNPMAFNTALAVAVTGAALAIGWPRASRAVLVAGVLDATLGAASLAEGLLGRGLGIDQLIVKAYVSGPHAIPGRPAAGTAVSLALIGAALLIWGRWHSRRRPAVLAAAGSLVGAIAITAITGYATGTLQAYTWGHATGMALLSAVAMLILAVCLLSVAWREAFQPHAGLPRWLPMPAGAAAFGLAGAVWQAIIAGSGGTGSRATNASAVLGLVMAGLVALVVWLAQQADGGRRVAVAAAARAAGVAARAAVAEAAARDGESRLFRFLDAMRVGLFIVTPGGEPYYVNDEAKRLLGLGTVPGISSVQLPGTYGAFVAGSDRLYPAEGLPVVRASLGESSHVADMEIRKPDGEVIPLEVWGDPVYGAGGQVDYGLAVIADMSDRQAGEKTLAEQAALLDLAHDAIVVRDRDNRIVYWNHGAERTFGYTRAEALGRVTHEILSTRFPMPVAGIEAAAARDGRWEGELIHRCADGRAITVESRWAVLYGPGGSVQRFMEINRDVTARKQAEREAVRGAVEIRALNATLEQQVRQRTVHLRRANKNLAAFTYSIAHDLRTPLRAMSGYAEVLAEEYGDPLGETGRGYTERIQAAAEHMSALIDDLLQLSHVSRAEMNLQDVDLSAEVTAICGEFQARDPGRRVRVSVEDGLRVTADRDLILVVLENLLDNAWKFTARRGEATITFAATTVDGERCYYVRDNGAGFDLAYADKLFQPFQRLHTADEFAGTGTGLATVQRIIERHGGRVWAEGAPGRGATFYFTFDAKPPSGFGELRNPAGNAASGAPPAAGQP